MKQTLEQRVSILENKVTKLSEENQDLKKEVKELRELLNYALEEIEKLKETIKSLTEKVSDMFKYAFRPMRMWLCGEGGARKNALEGDEQLVIKYPELLE